jgi:DNA-binding CsgD family transcriptional regulator
LPFSVEDGKLHQVYDESYGQRLFLSQHSPGGFWDEYFSHKGRMGWICFSIEASSSLPRLEAIDWLDWVGKDKTEIGHFLRKHDTQYVCNISNHADTGSSGFRFSLYRSLRTPFTENDIATASALFPHLHNLCVCATRPETNASGRARAAAAAAGLSEREQDVAVLLSERLSIVEIAERLFISRHTVEKHVEHIHLKLKVSGKRKVRYRLLGER